MASDNSHKRFDDEPNEPGDNSGSEEEFPTISVDSVLPPQSVRELSESDIELIDESEAGSWSEPPDSLDEFLDAGGDEAPASRSFLETPEVSVGPSSLDELMEHAGEDGQALLEEALDGEEPVEEPPSSLQALFSQLRPDSRPWWSAEEDDALARAPLPAPPRKPPGKRPPGKKPPLKKPPVRKRDKHAIPAPPPDEDDIAAAQALLRASGRPARPADVDIDFDGLEFPKPPKLPDAEDEGGDAAPGPKPVPKRAQAESAPNRQRTLTYLVGAVLVAVIAWLLLRGDEGTDRGDAARARPAASGGAPSGAAPTGAERPEPPSATEPGSTSTTTASALGPGRVPQWPLVEPTTTAEEPDTEAADAGGTGSGGASALRPPAWGDQPDAGAAPAAPTAAAAPFDRAAANAALQQAAGAAASCPRASAEGTRGVTVSVTFAPSGAVTTAMVAGGPYAGTATGSCIARAFRSARVPPFGGSFVTVHKSFQLR